MAERRSQNASNPWTPDSTTTTAHARSGSRASIARASAAFSGPTILTPLDLGANDATSVSLWAARIQRRGNGGSGDSTILIGSDPFFQLPAQPLLGADVRLPDAAERHLELGAHLVVRQPFHSDHRAEIPGPLVGASEHLTNRE